MRPAVDSVLTRKIGQTLTRRVGGPLGAPWDESLRPLCDDACRVAGTGVAVEVVVFYVARWCQKETGEHEPDVATIDAVRVADVAARVVGNVGGDGSRIDCLVAGDADAWTDLRRVLFLSAQPRAGAAAGEFADEALQKIAVVLLTGTPPSQAADRLAGDVDGPGNEYIFASPFSHWARAVVINLIVDEKRRAARERRAPRFQTPRKPTCLDTATLERAHAALPTLLEAMRDLPPVQRSVMAWTLMRSDIDPAVTRRLRDLAPDLFDDPDGAGGGGANGRSPSPVACDQDIADRLGTTARLVTANRSAARCKLAARDPLWALLLDVLLPHRSTRSPGEEGSDG